MSDSIQRYREMVARQPGNELVRFSLGKALFDAGDLAAARSELAQALARRPDWMVVQILIAKCDLAAGDLAAARAGLQRARELAIEQRHEGPQAEIEGLLAELG